MEDVKRLSGAESIEPLARARAYVPTADTADGAIGAAVFERLSQNMPPVKIVTDLKNVHPDCAIQTSSRASSPGTNG